MNLIKSLEKIAAKELKNTWGALPQMKERFELIREAYGASEVEQDFTKWCVEVKDRNPRYPIAEYLKVVDSRFMNKLGLVPSEETFEQQDARVEEISAITFQLTGRTAPSKYVRELLIRFSLNDIVDALREYVGGIENRELAYVAKMFFTDGGCGAVLAARKQKEQSRLEQIKKDAWEKTLINSLVEDARRKSEAEDVARIADEAKPKPTADDLFGPEIK